MFQDNELKIKLYIYPILMFALGTWASFSPGWEPFAVLMFVLGFVVAGHVIMVSVVREVRHHVEAQNDLIQEQRKLYETVIRMDSEARYQLGLGRPPTEVKVTVDKTKQVENEFSQAYHKIPIAPYKLKTIASAALNGEKFTVRKWAGDGKLLSRSEWDAASEKMLELGMVEVDSTEGTIWTGFGIDVLTQVLKDTL